MFTLHVYANDREYGDGEPRPMRLTGNATGYDTIGVAIEAAQVIAERDFINVMVFDLASNTERGWVRPKPTVDELLDDETGFTADERAWIG